jgi:tungstate transport system ATP-binding protein
MTVPVIEVKDLTVRRGKRIVLSIPEFSVKDGEVLAVIGPNGAGKSTLLQALALLLPAEMTYSFLGRHANLPADALALRRQMAVVFQEPHLLQGSVSNNVSVGMRLRGVSKGEASERASQWLKHFGVDHLATRHAKALSGGEAQRVSLARAFAMAPRVLFLDEPFRSLDVLARASLMPTLRAALRETKTTALLVTHDFAEVIPLADRLAVVLEGKVVQMAPPLEVFRRPQDPRIADLLNAAVGLANGLADAPQTTGASC